MTRRHSTEVLSDRAVIGRFYERLNAGTMLPWLDLISNYFPSDSDVEKYAWLGQAPVMRRWVDGRNTKQLAKFGFEIVNDDYEATLGIPTSHLRRDKTGQLRIRMDDLVKRTRTHWAKLITNLIKNGETAVCYDGKPYFATNHQEGNGPIQSNLLTKADTPKLGVVDVNNVTPDEFVKAIMAGIKHLLSLKDDTGEPRNEDAMKFNVMVPIDLWDIAEISVSNNLLSAAGGGNVDNVLKNTKVQIDVASNGRLDWTTDFMISVADAPEKSFIRQEEKEIDVDFLGPGSEHAFKHKEFLLGVDCSRAVGYGAFYQSVKCKLATK